MSRAATALCLGALVAIGSGCTCRGSDDERVARLEQAGGAVTGARADGAWTPVTLGHWFEIGDAARTGPDGGALLSLRHGGGLRMAPETILRFGRGPAPDVPRVSLEIGSSELVTGDEEVSVELDVGVARIAPGSRVRLATGDDGVRFEVVVGSSRVTRADGEQITLAGGQGLEVEVGGALVERIAVGAADAGAPPDAEAPRSIEVTVEGKGVRARTGDGAPEVLEAGTHPIAGTTEVTLGAGDRLEVVRGAERVVVTGPAEVVVAPPGGALLATRRGNADASATTVDVQVDVPGGSFLVRRGPGDGSIGQVQVPTSGPAQIRARRGRVDVVGARGGRESIHIGEMVEVDSGGGLTVTERAPELADLSVPAGETAIIHAPAPPVAVEIRFAEACAGDGIVELAEGSSFARQVRIGKGTGAARVLADRGTHAYRVRCLDQGTLGKKPAAEGSLRVIRDRGTRPLARGAPRNVIDADGRRYTVLYQNKLPSITFRWKTAAAGPYRLEVEHGGKTRGYDLEKPEYTTGSFSEGEYRFRFTADGGASSKTSTLRIDFDNAAPSAYISQPVVGKAFGGDQVRVAGAALEGWSVSVEGAGLALDRQHRFSAQVAVPPRRRGIAVRFAHPRRGVHYFLRRDPKR
jgi:hypothetical protein